MSYREAVKKLPNYMQNSLIDYIERGVPTGGFLKVVLSNDLIGAFAKADSTNIERIRDYVMFMYNDMPSESHGSLGAYTAWIARGGMRGQNAA